MLLPIFFIVLIFIFFISRILIREYFVQEQRRKAYIYLNTVLLVFCTGDHVVGYFYSQFWLEGAEGEANVIVVTDSIAFHSIIVEGNFMKTSSFLTNRIKKDEYSVIFYGPRMVDVDNGLMNHHKYSAIQVETSSYGYLEPNQFYELRVVSDENDPRCRAFFNVEKSIPTEKRRNEWRSRWKQAAIHSFKNGEIAQCVAVQSIPKLTAEYLVESVRHNIKPYEKFLGLESISTPVRITKLSDGKIIGECRSVTFGGGWVQRFVLTNLEGAHITYDFKSIKACPGYAPKSHQMVK